MPKDDFTNSHDVRELEQEKILLKKINIDLQQKSKITQTEKEALEYAKLLVKTTPLPIVPQTKLYDWWKKFRD